MNSRERVDYEAACCGGGGEGGAGLGRNLSIKSPVGPLSNPKLNGFIKPSHTHITVV